MTYEVYFGEHTEQFTEVSKVYSDDNEFVFYNEKGTVVGVANKNSYEFIKLVMKS